MQQVLVKSINYSRNLWSYSSLVAPAPDLFVNKTRESCLGTAYLAVWAPYTKSRRENKVNTNTKIFRPVKKLCIKFENFLKFFYLLCKNICFFHYRKVFIPNRFGFFPRSNSKFIKQTLKREICFINWNSSLWSDLSMYYFWKKKFSFQFMKWLVYVLFLERKLFFPKIVHRQVTS